MKKITTYGLLVCLALMNGCSSIYGVKYDYNKETDFSGYQSYDWMPVPDRTDMNDLVIDRIKRSVASELGAKGLKKTTAWQAITCWPH